jgi:hypothetical protein
MLIKIDYNEASHTAKQIDASAPGPVEGNLCQEEDKKKAAAKKKKEERLRCFGISLVSYQLYLMVSNGIPKFHIISTPSGCLSFRHMPPG